LEILKLTLDKIDAKEKNNLWRRSIKIDKIVQISWNWDS
jgi:hypothetical protein